MRLSLINAASLTQSLFKVLLLRSAHIKQRRSSEARRRSAEKPAPASISCGRQLARNAFRRRREKGGKRSENREKVSERERERESESRVRRSRIRVAVHQASLASRCDFTRCSFPPFIEKPSPRAETSSALVGSERVRVYMYAGVCVCVYVCVCVCVCVWGWMSVFV